ncbi:PAS domain S-box-containing protein [Motilibacter peucedani]|uniref:PAS domain S-box-containing protein n=1 Tax=Motilibacter peucedani TaxID=598650 RepID=A0A420XKY8_9ACTN|nr:SpoIIE family protein phosphatase [Motilibacter peucedani]RKS68497.1 PAS domain S-box-containing protein [Motilibacter peucedani]
MRRGPIEALAAQADGLGIEAVASGAEGRRRLPRVLSDIPFAVLVLDTDAGTVTYSNPLARELCDSVLPFPVSEWARDAGFSAGLDDDGPFAQAAAGSAVRGASVVQRPRDGAPPRVLWLTAAPLPEVIGLAAASLVILLAVDPGLLTDELFEVRGRALVAAGLSFTITDPHREDNPLVWVNPAFLATTGYTEDEVIGVNCRFLQGPDTDPAAIVAMREAIDAQQPTQVVLLNYRKDGTAFWNEVSLSPVFDGAERLTHYVGVQADVTARVEAELLREERVREEQDARRRSELVQSHLTLLSDATETLVASLEVPEALRRLADLLVPRVADWCIVDLPPEAGDDGAHEVVVTCADPALEESRAAVEAMLPGSIGPRSRLGEVFTTGRSSLLRSISPDDMREVGSPELLEHYSRLGLGSSIVVPLTGRHGVLGTLTLVVGGSGRHYDDDDLSLASDLARRAGLIVDNARLYAREHHVAEALQRSMLPALPDIDGLDIAARYLPGGVGAQVGGDWYDVLALPDGAVGVAIGDVMGHDMAAAAAMGQLRSVLRSYAWQGQSAGQVLDSLDRLVQGLDMAQLATAVFARLLLEEESGTTGVRVEYANAGHLPGLVLEPDGTVRRWNEAWSVLIGAPDEGTRTTATDLLVPGSALVLVTDGLVEVRGQDLDEGLDRLDAALASLVDAPSADALIDGLLEAMRAQTADDDIAVLVVRVLACGPGEEGTALPHDPTAASVARRFLRRTLDGLGDEHLQVALLLVSEVASNAVAHGAGEVRLHARLLPDGAARVEVSDTASEAPVLRSQGVDDEGFPAERGRGVYLLEHLSRAWGTEPAGRGKTVWFEVGGPEGGLAG